MPQLEGGNEHITPFSVNYVKSQVLLPGCPGLQPQSTGLQTVLNWALV